MECKRPKSLLHVNIWGLSFTLGDGAGAVVGIMVGLVVVVITLGGGIAICVGVVVSNIGSLAVLGCFVARFNIWENLTYAFVVGDPYSRDGVLFCASCNITRISVAAWQR